MPSKKGFIVLKNSGILNAIMQALDYQELEKRGKVSVLNIDDSWKNFLSDAGQGDCLNHLIEAAIKAKNGLLVINISNIEIFKYCWALKQLAKQEWRSYYDNKFYGYVLIVLEENISWEEVKKVDDNSGELSAMMNYYYFID